MVLHYITITQYYIIIIFSILHSPDCRRCKSNPGTFLRITFYVFLSCNKIIKFWDSIHVAVQVLHLQFNMTLCLYLLNAQQDFVLDSDSQNLFMTFTCLRKKLFFFYGFLNLLLLLKCGSTKL